MRRAQWVVIAILILQLLLGGAVHAHAPDVHGAAVGAAESAHADHDHGVEPHEHHDHAGQCGLCGSCLGAAPPTPADADSSAPGERFAADHPGYPRHRIDTLLRPPRHFV